MIEFFEDLIVVKMFGLVDWWFTAVFNHPVLFICAGTVSGFYYAFKTIKPKHDDVEILGRFFMSGLIGALCFPFLPVVIAIFIYISAIFFPFYLCAILLTKLAKRGQVKVNWYEDMSPQGVLCWHWEDNLIWTKEYHADTEAVSTSRGGVIPVDQLTPLSDDEIEQFKRGK